MHIYYICCTCSEKTPAVWSLRDIKTVLIFSRVTFYPKGIFLNYISQSPTFWGRGCWTWVKLLWRNLSIISSTRFQILLKALMTPNGMEKDVALHSMVPESFLKKSFCLLFSHFSCSYISCPPIFLTAFNVADCNPRLAVLLSSRNHHTH